MNDGGLRAPQTVGISATTAQQIHDFWATFDDMELDLQIAGFAPEEKPPYTCPELTPEMLATIDNARYGAIYQQYEAWHDYAINLFRRIQASALGYKNNLIELDAHLRREVIRASLAADEKRPTLQQQEDEVVLNPDRKALKLELQKLEQQELIMRSHVEKLQRNLAMISRQVEIRRQDLDGKMTGYGMASRGMHQPR